MTMDALILAAGRGTRLLPFSENQPKPLLPLINKAILGHSLERLIKADIEKIGVVIAKQDQKIPQYITQNFKELDIQYIVQDSALGTAHAVMQIEKHLQTEHFLVIAGDSLFSADFIKKMMFAQTKDNNAITLSLEYMEFDQMRHSSTVEYRDGQVWEIKEKPETPEQVLSKYNSSAFYAFSSTIFDILKQIEKSKRDEYELATAINETINQQKRVGGLITKRVCHITTPFDLWYHNLQFLAERKKGDKDGNILGLNVDIDASSSVKNSIIGDNTTIQRDLTLRNTVILPNSVIDRNYSNCLVKTPYFQEFSGVF